MLTEGIDQFVGRVTGNLVATLPSPDGGAELDLRKRQNGKSMSRGAGGESKQSLRALLIHIELDKGASF
jgi:hypothetical protein